MSARWPGKCKDCLTKHKKGDQISSNPNNNWCSLGDKCPACFRTTGSVQGPAPEQTTPPTPEQAIINRNNEDNQKLTEIQKNIKSLQKLYNITDDQINQIKSNVGLILITDQISRAELFPTDKDPRGDRIGMITKLALGMDD